MKFNIFKTLNTPINQYGINYQEYMIKDNKRKSAQSKLEVNYLSLN